MNLPLPLLLSVVFVAPILPGQTAPHPPSNLPAPAKLFPLEADLVAPLNTAKLHIGDSILLKLDKDWSDGNCTFARGSALHGRVTALGSPSAGAKQSSVSLLFQYACADVPPQPLTFIAILAPDTSSLAGVHGNPVTVQAMRSPSFGGSRGLTSPGNTANSRTDLSGRQNPDMPVFLGEAPDRSVPRPVMVKNGEVWHLAGISLTVGDGPDASSTLSIKKKSLHLTGGSVLVLRPLAASAAILPGAPEPSSPATPTVSQRRANVLPAEITACEAPVCSVVREPASSTPHEPSPRLTLPVQGLGYSGLSTAELSSLQYRTALAFLGPDQLLFTFDPHTLVSRRSTDRSEDRPHIIRAVLFNLSTGKVIRTENWRVADDRQYLWPLDGSQVLVHDGDHLRWLGPGLEEHASLPLAGSLAYVRSSPDRQHYLVGTIRELHSGTEHAELAGTDVRGPEEQISVQLLDGHLAEVDSFHESSRALPPLLSNAGIVTLLHASGQHWYLRETPWSGSIRNFAHIRSDCIPSVTGAADNLLLLTGCDVRTVDRWYRILRPDGSLVLRGVLTSRQMDPLLPDSSVGRALALALPDGGPSYTPETPFHLADMASETINVHRIADGGLRLTLRMHQPSPDRQPLALSSSGDLLAIIDGTDIRIFDLPASTGAPAKDLASRSLD